MESTTPLRLIRLDQTVFDEAQRLRKQLAPVLKFKTLSAFIAHILGVNKAAPEALGLTPERLLLLELRDDIYAKLEAIQELLVAQSSTR